MSVWGMPEDEAVRQLHDEPHDDRLWQPGQQKRYDRLQIHEVTNVHKSHAQERYRCTAQEHGC